MIGDLNVQNSNLRRKTEAPKVMTELLERPSREGLVNDASMLAVLQVPRVEVFQPVLLANDINLETFAMKRAYNSCSK